MLEKRYMVLIDSFQCNVLLHSPAREQSFCFFGSFVHYFLLYFPSLCPNTFSLSIYLCRIRRMYDRYRTYITYDIPAFQFVQFQPFVLHAPSIIPRVVRAQAGGVPSLEQVTTHPDEKSRWKEAYKETMPTTIEASSRRTTTNDERMNECERQYDDEGHEKKAIKNTALKIPPPPIVFPALCATYHM